MVFGREANFEFAEEISHLYMDGTFKLAPLIFKQIYVVLAERNGYVFPLVYCLLVNKQRRTYERLFSLLHTTWPSLDVSPMYTPSISETFSYNNVGFFTL